MIKICVDIIRWEVQMVKEDELRKAIEAANCNVIEKTGIPELINKKYTELITEAINKASKYIEKSKSPYSFSHTLKVLFDRAESKEGLKK